MNPTEPEPRGDEPLAIGAESETGARGHGWELSNHAIRFQVPQADGVLPARRISRTGREQVAVRPNGQCARVLVCPR